MPEGKPIPERKLMHAMIRIGDSAVMLVDESPDWGAMVFLAGRTLAKRCLHQDRVCQVRGFWAMA